MSASPVRLLAICGSLRAASSSGALIAAAVGLAPAGAVVEIASSVGDLPHFNPDLDAEGAAVPAVVAEFRARLRAADGVLICTPEYIHGVPGSLKNALDWVASTGDLIDRPVLLINPSGTSTHGHESLAETLRVLMAVVEPIRIALRTNKVDVAAILDDPGPARALAAAVAALAEAARARRAALG